MKEIIPNLDDVQFKAFLLQEALKVGDTIETRDGVLEVKGIFTEEAEYEEVLDTRKNLNAPDSVVYRRSFADGILLKKQNSNVFVFFPYAEIK